MRHELGWDGWLALVVLLGTLAASAMYLGYFLRMSQEVSESQCEGVGG